MARVLALDPAVIRRLRELSKKERAECLLALCELPEAFGKPLAHAGIGVRKLGKKLFECRAGISLRFLFLERLGEFYVSFLGNHDEIKRLPHDDSERDDGMTEGGSVMTEGEGAF